MERCDSYVCVWCSLQNAYRDGARTADRLAQKWMTGDGLAKARQRAAQKHNRKVRKEERDRDKKLLDIEGERNVRGKHFSESLKWKVLDEVIKDGKKDIMDPTRGKQICSNSCSLDFHAFIYKSTRFI
mmetsp:Transcript_47070/g.91872  ORF Transcript_47070/g.91872 Transcript_47070/m.91872 type:complete len:128 (-) Transcript_47070:429-812(-)